MSGQACVHRVGNPCLWRHCRDGCPRSPGLCSACSSRVCHALRICACAWLSVALESFLSCAPSLPLTVLPVGLPQAVMPVRRRVARPLMHLQPVRGERPQQAQLQDARVSCQLGLSHSLCLCWCPLCAARAVRRRETGHVAAERLLDHCPEVVSRYVCVRACVFVCMCDTHACPAALSRLLRSAHETRCVFACPLHARARACPVVDCVRHACPVADCVRHPSGLLVVRAHRAACWC